MEYSKKFFFVKRNISEILGERELEKLLKSRKKNPVVYWGTAPTGRPHVGYFLPILKISDLLKAGFKVKILLADLHAALDNTPWEVLDKRYKYYSNAIKEMLGCLGTETKNIEFVRGSDFQLDKKYIYDLLKISSLVSVRDSTKAASEVVKSVELGKARVSGLIYPLMQVLDEVYLGADVQLGGTDQRKIMVLAREVLPKIGHSPRIEIMNPIIPGLVGKKMSSSNENTKIDLLDSEETVKNKIRKAEMVIGDSNNGVMAFLKYVLMVIKNDLNEPFILERDERYGGNIEYFNYEELEKDYLDGKVHPLDVKNSVAREINLLLKPFRKKIKFFEKISKEAYGR